ncbi:MAG TPA: rod shape-determining protein MreD [Myxococcota bacterium]|nr:rod shape-determining protein MreD [Myxococcota bacterium]
MSALVRLVAIGLALLLTQTVTRLVLPTLVQPDLVLVYALALGLRGGGVQGLVLAFGAGFIEDVLSASPPGLFALLCGTACAATRLLDRALYLRAAAPWAGYVAIYTLANFALVGAAQRMFAPGSEIAWSDLLARAPGAAITTALCAAPLLHIFRRLLVEADRDGSWPVLAAQGPRGRP